MHDSMYSYDNTGWYAEPLIGLDLIGLVQIDLDLVCLVLIGYQYG